MLTFRLLFKKIHKLVVDGKRNHKNTKMLFLEYKKRFRRPAIGKQLADVVEGEEGKLERYRKH